MISQKKLHRCKAPVGECYQKVIFNCAVQESDLNRKSARRKPFLTKTFRSLIDFSSNIGNTIKMWEKELLSDA